MKEINTLPQHCRYNILMRHKVWSVIIDLTSIYLWQSFTYLETISARKRYLTSYLFSLSKWKMQKWRNMHSLNEWLIGLLQLHGWISRQIMWTPSIIFFPYCIHSSQIYYRIIVRILPVRMGEPANPLMRISNAIARLAIWVSFCSGFLKLIK